VFKRRFDAQFGRATRAANAMPRTGNAISVVLRVAGDRSASAIVTTVVRGKSTHWPEIAIDVMDKPLGTREIEQLAGEIARVATQGR